MLVATPKRFYEQQRLYFKEDGLRNSISGLKVALFGGTSAIGTYFGGEIGQIGSGMVLPHRALGDMWDARMKELKVTADMGNQTLVRLTDMTNPKECEVPMMNCKTVVSCIGSNIFAQTEKEFEDSNIRVPVAIAKAVKANPQIKRFIMLS